MDQWIFQSIDTLQVILCQFPKSNYFSIWLFDQTTNLARDYFEYCLFETIPSFQFGDLFQSLVDLFTFDEGKCIQHSLEDILWVADSITNT